MAGKLVTIFARKVTIAQAPSQDDVFRTLAWLQEVVNETWARRQAIVPSFERRKPRQPLQVWELLPRSNCKACGEATCLAFAFGLLKGQRHLRRGVSDDERLSRNRCR